MKSLRIVASAKGSDLADGLINGGEAGLLHLRAISHVIGRKIRVWDTSGRVLGVFADRIVNEERTNGPNLRFPCVFKESNKSKEDCYNSLLGSDGNRRCSGETRASTVLSDKNSSNVESYLELEYQFSDRCKIGHWVKKGGDLKEEKNYLTQRNNCLFTAICQQCLGYEPDTLRTLTADTMRSQHLVAEEGFPQFQGSGVLLLGGAKYDGVNVLDAKRILDNSQGTRGYNHAARAHPRGHASHPSQGDTDCVEKYSRSATRDFPKSAWMSREEQDASIHELLLTQDVQEGIARLNRGETRVVIKMDVDFQIRVGLWAGGEMFRGPLLADFVTILLQHHEDKYSDHSADVQIFTCYPMAPQGREAPAAGASASASIPRVPFLKRILSHSEEDVNEPNPSKKFKFDDDM